MAHYVQDYTKGKNNYDLMQSILQGSMKPIQGANAATSLGKVLTAYFASKGMSGANKAMNAAVTGRDNQSRMDLENAMGAYRGDTMPRPGVTDRGTGSNVSAMAEALMGSHDPATQKLGMSNLMGLGKTNQPTSNMRDHQYRQSLSPEEQQVFDDNKLIRSERGDRIDFLHPITGALVKSTPKGLAPKDQPDHIAEAAGAAEEAKLGQQLVLKPQIEAAVTAARVQAQESGEVFNDWSRAKAAMPGLLTTVGELKGLAVIATSTWGGIAWDTAVKQLGFGATKGATAKAKFVALINNQVLPLLKPTFGGSFSIQEGESLKATMGDANATPEEKLAQLSAFIENKYREIETKQRQLDEVGRDDDATIKVIKWEDM